MLVTQNYEVKEGIEKQYENEKHHLIKYLQQYDYKLKSFRVTYVKAKHGYGRPVILKSLGCLTLRKRIRKALMKDNYYDFDQSNAQSENIRYICRANNTPCPKMEEYCENRTAVLTEIALTYGVENTSAKKLFIRMCFFRT